MSKITIDRAVLERVLNAILYTVPQAANQAKEQLESLWALREALAQPQQGPMPWKHDCAALLMNGVELWVDHCPHCGKPRTSTPQRKPLTAGDRDKVFDRADKRMQSNTNTSWRNAIVDEVEAAHGIKESK